MVGTQKSLPYLIIVKNQIKKCKKLAKFIRKRAKLKKHKRKKQEGKNKNEI